MLEAVNLKLNMRGLSLYGITTIRVVTLLNSSITNLLLHDL